MKLGKFYAICGASLAVYVGEAFGTNAMLQGCWRQVGAESIHSDGRIVASKPDCVHIYSSDRNVVACASLKEAAVYRLGKVTASEYTRTRTDFYLERRRTNAAGDEDPKTFNFTRAESTLILERPNLSPKRAAKDPVKYKNTLQLGTPDLVKTCADILEYAVFLDSSIFQRDHFVDSFEKITFGKYDEAAEGLKRGRSLRPNDPLILNNYAVLLARKGDYAGALVLLEQALPASKTYEVADEALIYAKEVKGDANAGQLVAYQPHDAVTPIKGAYAGQDLFIPFDETAYVKLKRQKPIDPMTKKRKPFSTLDSGVVANIAVVKKLQR